MGSDRHKVLRGRLVGGRKQHGEWRQSPDPYTDSNEVQDIGGEMDCAAQSGGRAGMAGPCQRSEKAGSEQCRHQVLPLRTVPGGPTEQKSRENKRDCKTADPSVAEARFGQDGPRHTVRRGFDHALAHEAGRQQHEPREPGQKGNRQSSPHKYSEPLVQRGGRMIGRRRAMGRRDDDRLENDRSGHDCGRSDVNRAHEDERVHGNLRIKGPAVIEPPFPTTHPPGS
jgi:hypothetical protein